MEEWTQLRCTMEDAGCDERSIAKAEALYASGAQEIGRAHV